MEQSMTLLIGLLVGLLAGGLHFGVLGYNLRLFTAGRIGAALSVQALRLFFSAGLLASLIQLGLGPLLAGAAGLLLARQWFIRRQGQVA